MKLKHSIVTLLVTVLFLSSCAIKKRIHDVPKDRNADGSFQYCGGELWGYAIDLMGKPPGENFWNKKFVPDRPHLAVFLHMNTALAQKPESTLILWYIIRSKQSIEAQFDSNNLLVKVDGKKQQIKIELLGIQYARTIKQLYSANDYDIRPHKPSKNEWKVGKKNHWLFDRVTSGYKVVKAPLTTKKEVDEKNIDIRFDPKKYDEIYLQFAKNIWPYKSSLRNSVIAVTTPKLTINGKLIPERTFQFKMNYEKVKKNRSKYGRCPSTAEIFRWST